MFAASEHDADALYFGKVSVPDAFVSFGSHGRKIALVNRLEFSRVQKEGAFDEVLPLEEWQKLAGPKRRGLSAVAEIIRLLAERYEVRRFRVAVNFPAGLFVALQEAEVPVEVADGPLFPERVLKSDAEAEAIRAGNAASSAGFRAAERALRAAEIRRGRLTFEGRTLTSERLRELVEIACLQQGAVALNTIVAGGDQACDPHCRGSGPLRPNELIIVDIFPRVAASGYHGDMTRTYLKGEASDAQRHLVETVREAQRLAIPLHREGALGKSIYKRVVDYFRAQGYVTETVDGVSRGFFHGLGHGLGLEVHEPPRVNSQDGELVAGHVVTVEPGLYYPGLGACRIEDVVRVTKGDPEMLSRHSYRWEFR